MSGEQHNQNVFPKIGFVDPVHGLIKIDGRLRCIIDTKEFQRLRNIKQLGLEHFVYPCANGTRFEHSLGVCYLVQQLLDHLRKEQPHLNITKKDWYSVLIAALLHDVGHGPFSHLYEEAVNGFNSDKSRPYKHEHQSNRILERIFEKDSVKVVFEGIIDDKELTFIKELIDPYKNIFSPGSTWPYKGRTKDKSFLYEIVANSDTGIDLDKVDYTQRDCIYLAMNTGIQWSRCLETIRVYKDDSTNLNRLAFRTKVKTNLNDIINTRRNLHIKAYKHKCLKLLDEMFLKVMYDSSSCLTFGKSKLSLCDAWKDLDTFIEIDDSIFQMILFSDVKELKDSRDLLERIVERDIPKFCGHAEVADKAIKLDFEIYLEHMIKNMYGEQSGPRFYTSIIKLDYGVQCGNPLKKIPFYTKNEEDACHVSDDFTDGNKNKVTILLLFADKHKDSNFFSDMLKKFCEEKGKKYLGSDDCPNIELD